MTDIYPDLYAKSKTELEAEVLALRAARDAAIAELERRAVVLQERWGDDAAGLVESYAEAARIVRGDDG